MSSRDRFTPTKNFRFQKFGLRCRPNGSTGRVRWQNFLLSRISFANKCMLDLAVFSGLQRKFLAQYRVGENTGLLHFNQLVLVVVNNFRLVLNATLLSAFWCAVVLPRKFWKICVLELLEYVSSGDIGADDVRGGILFVPSTIYQEYGKYVTLHFNNESELDLVDSTWSSDKRTHCTASREEVLKVCVRRVHTCARTHGTEVLCSARYRSARIMHFRLAGRVRAGPSSRAQPQACSRGDVRDCARFRAGVLLRSLLRCRRWRQISPRSSS